MVRYRPAMALVRCCIFEIVAPSKNPEMHVRRLSSEAAQTQSIRCQAVTAKIVGVVRELVVECFFRFGSLEVAKLPKKLRIDIRRCGENERLAGRFGSLADV